MRYLLQVRLENRGTTLWTLRPMNAQRGEKSYKIDITDMDFITLLRRIQAKDNNQDPRSFKSVRYQDMIDGARTGKQDTLWMWNTHYPINQDVAYELALN